MSVRCDVHNLAAGPDGRCVLCRGAGEAGRRREGRRLGWALSSAFALLGVALAGYGAWRRAERSRISTATATAEVAASVPVVPAPTVAPEPAKLEAVALQPALLVAPRVEAVATATAPPSAPAPTAVASPPAPATTQAVTAEQIRAALVATPIVMFTAPWCSVCARAHAFLNANGLRCVDRDIDADADARRELKARTGTTSIPTLEIDGELQRPGFSERAIERALARGVETRLGVKGISILR